MCVNLLLPANEVWGKVIFLHLFVILFTVGVPGPGVGSAPGGSVPRGSAPGVPCSGGGLLPVCGGVCSGGGVPGGDPPRRLLLRTVRILLECILV